MSFSRLLEPKSIAVIGGREAEEVVRQCQKSGYSGAIWPVHPSKEKVGDLPVYKSVKDLPTSPDAAYVAVNRQMTVSVVKELAEIGAGGAICYATGFSESGELGKQLQQELLIASGDMPLLGPNCYGLLNYCDGATLWPDQHGGERVDSGVAIVTQSSNVAVNFTMQKRGLPMAYVVSLGNKLKFDLHHAIREFAKQPHVTAIGLYIEGITSPVEFESAVIYAKELGKPVVAIKSGRTEAAKQIALSHTASLAGADDLVDALFLRCGVGRVYSMDALVEALKVLHIKGPLPGYKFGLMAPSGGDAVMAADALETTRFELGQLAKDHYKEIKSTVHELVTVSNPFDYQLFDWLNTEKLSKTYRAFIERNFDISISMIDYPRADRCSATDWLPSQQAMIDAIQGLDVNVAVMSMLPEGMPESAAKLLMDNGIIPLAGLHEGIEGLQAAADIGKAWKNLRSIPLLKANEELDIDKLQILDEAESKKILSDYGVAVPNHLIVTSSSQMQKMIDKLQFPVVVKGLGIAHKTDVGAVKLNLTSLEEVTDAINAMAHLTDRFLIEEMVDDVVAELIVGVSRDEQFGPYVVVGAGGIWVELMADAQSILLPVDKDEVLDALAKLKCAPLFNGFRGMPHADLDAAADAILAVTNFIRENVDKIAELDINPLMLRPAGKGVMAADALIRMIK